MKEVRNYPFIDQIRAIAMISIVFEHSIWLGPMSQLSPVSLTIYDGLIQLSKFGTICFFLLAGFLIGDKFFEYTPAEYFRKRVAKVAVPWFVWTLIFLGTLLLDELARYLRFGSDRMTTHFSETMTEHLKHIYLFSNYWFILNFLICIGILLAIRKHLYSLWPGVVFLVFTLFYSVNIYYEWIIPQHSVALLGFVFFLWLGAQFFRYWNKIQAWVYSVPVVFFILWILLSIIFSLVDIKYLRLQGSADPYNSLRISNISFSFSVFFLLVKIRDLSIVNRIKPRETTFGIFLIHYIIVASVLPLISKPLKIDPENLSMPSLVGYQVIRFIVVYLTTLLLVKLINKSKYKWLVGK